MAESGKDQSVLGNIQKLADEEHRLLAKGSLEPKDTKRLAKVQQELDQCWDLLRQRRAKREFGEDPNRAHLRSGETVENYVE
jgi:uncharacterized protein DUF2630